MFLSGMLARGRTRVKAQLPSGYVPVVRWLPAVVWMGFIFFLSHQSRPLGSVSSLTAGASLAHLGLYAALAVLLFWALAGRTGDQARSAAWVQAIVAFSLTTLYGFLDELHQAFVAGRVASEADLALDAAGALIGVAMAYLATVFLNGGRMRQ